MLVVKAWRHYYTCIGDIIALLLHRMLGWTHWSVFQRGIMSHHHFKGTELRMGHLKVIWSSLITVSRVSMDLLHQWTVIMVEWVCIRKSLYLTQEDLAGEVRQGIQINKTYLPADRPHPRIGHTPNFQWFSWEKKIVRSSTRINKPKFEINNS